MKLKYYILTALTIALIYPAGATISCTTCGTGCSTVDSSESPGVAVPTNVHNTPLGDAYTVPCTYQGEPGVETRQVQHHTEDTQTTYSFTRICTATSDCVPCANEGSYPCTRTEIASNTNNYYWFKTILPCLPLIET